MTCSLSTHDATADLRIKASVVHHNTILSHRSPSLAGITASLAWAR